MLTVHGTTDGFVKFSLKSASTFCLMHGLWIDLMVFIFFFVEAESAGDGVFPTFASGGGAAERMPGFMSLYVYIFLPIHNSFCSNFLF